MWDKRTTQTLFPDAFAFFSVFRNWCSGKKQGLDRKDKLVLNHGKRSTEELRDRRGPKNDNSNNNNNNNNDKLITCYYYYYHYYYHHYHYYYHCHYDYCRGESRTIFQRTLESQPGKELTWKDKPSECQIGGWKAVSASGLQGRGTPVGPADCNHYNCSHILFRDSSHCQ